MEILDLLATDNFILYNKTIAKGIGVENAVLFGALCSYQKSFKGEEFYREQEKIMQDTALTEYAVRKGIKDLQEYGLIIVTKKGLPAKYYFRINEKMLLKILKNGESGGFISSAENSTTSGHTLGGYLSTSGAEIDTTSGYENSTTGGAEIDTTINNNNNNNNNNFKRESVERKKPTLEQVKEFAQSKGRSDLAQKFFDYYEQGNWHDKDGKAIKNWKLKFITWLNKEPKQNNNDTGIKHQDKELTPEELSYFDEFLNTPIDELENIV